MMTLLNSIIKIFGSNFPSIILKAIDFGSITIKCIQRIYDRKDKKEILKNKKSDDKVIDDVCDKGGISDILDLGNRLTKSLVFTFVILSGCQTIEITATKQWEGRYESEKQLQEVVEKIHLEKDESAWLISNSTLKQVLKNTRK